MVGGEPIDTGTTNVLFILFFINPGMFYFFFFFKMNTKMWLLTFDSSLKVAKYRYPTS